MTYINPDRCDPNRPDESRAARAPTLAEIRFGVVSEIAKDELTVPTLEVRRSDSLDFHTVSVWALREALERAFDAGRKSAGA